MRNRNILVTGASGFTGTWLTRRLLNSGANVFTILSEEVRESPIIEDQVIDRITCIKGSILDFDLLARTVQDCGIDTVFHLAAVSVEGLAQADPRTSFDVNVRGTYHVLEACRVNAGRVTSVIVASSDKVYGDSPHLPYTEELPVQGMYPYDSSKSCADLIARCYFTSYGLPVAVARFANIYGGGDLNWSRLIPNTIRRLLGHERPVIRSPRDDLHYERDFLYVEDQVRAYLALMDAMSRPGIHGQAFNFGMCTRIPVPQVVSKIQKLMDAEDVEPIYECSDHGEIIRQELSSEKAKKELGWVPAYALDEGLTETIAWYRRNLRGLV
jgi:CDP-glucose 4,6-dehydratase